MKTEDILAIEPKVLTREQREAYFRDGYLLLEKIIDDAWIERLRGATDAMIEESRHITQSDEKWDLEDGHCAEDPRLRRLSSPNDHHPDYWAFASQSIVPDIVADLIGPHVKFHHAKLNFKWARGGEEVKWHQDIGFWPHTNYSPLTVGAYMYDCDLDQGPVGMIPGSHDGELYNQYNDAGEWIGCLRPDDAATVDESKAVYLDGPAGSLTIHNCRMIHGSKPNRSGRGRPLLLNVYAPADAMAYTHNPLPSKYDGTMVRGEAQCWAHHDPRPCLLPPDWSGGYTSIFALQQEENARGAEARLRYHYRPARNRVTSALTRSGNSHSGKPPPSLIVTCSTDGKISARAAAASRKSGKSCSPFMISTGVMRSASLASIGSNARGARPASSHGAPLKSSMIPRCSAARHSSGRWRMTSNHPPSRHQSSRAASMPSSRAVAATRANTVETVGKGRPGKTGPSRINETKMSGLSQANNSPAPAPMWVPQKCALVAPARDTAAPIPAAKVASS